MSLNLTGVRNRAVRNEGELPSQPTMSPVERERLNQRVLARLKLQARGRGVRQEQGEMDDPNDPNIFLSEPMDLAFRLLKIQPGLEDAAQSIVSGSSAPEISQIEEPPEIEEEESEMDRLDRELKVAEDALARSREIHSKMGENWKGTTRRDMRGNVETRGLPRDRIDLGYE